MGITFYSPEAPQIVTATYSCECVDFSENGEVQEDCFECGGEGEVHFYGTATEINVSNSNGFELLEVLGLPQDYYGQVRGSDELATVVRRITKILNSDIDDEGIESSVQEGETKIVTDADGLQRVTKGATLIACGRAPGYIRSRLEQFRTLFLEAVQNDWDVVWG